MAAIDIRLNPGERGLLVGQTGSGKSMAAAWMAKHAEQQVVILDSKHEPLFESLASPHTNEKPGLLIVQSQAELGRALAMRKGPDYILLRPSVEEVSEPSKLDEYLMYLYNHARDIYILIDEAYQLHTASRAGPGLIALLTRGRARAQTTLMATQRPAWLSRFALTEAQRFYLFKLADRRDWKTLAEIIPGLQIDPPKPMKPYQFQYFKQGEYDSPILMAPLKPIADVGYTPQLEIKKKRKWF